MTDPTTPGGLGMTGAERIAAERQRQIDEEGYTAEHDRGHAAELFMAARCYMESAYIAARFPGQRMGCPMQWPWDARYWKPTGDPVRDAEKAGALASAGIDAWADR